MPKYIKSPGRTTAFVKHYAAERAVGRVFDSVDAARQSGSGEWLCVVQFLGHDLFYVRCNFSIPGSVGAVYGRWNELRLIEQCL